MKHNRALLFVLAILIFVPSFVGIYSYMKTETAPIATDTANSISIADLNGKVSVLEKKAEDDEASKLIGLFLRLNENAQKVAALPDPLMGAAFFKVEIASPSKTDIYQYYFSKNPAECYYVDSTGNAYGIAVADAEEFIKTEYASSLYTEAVLPELTISGIYAVKPATADWQYKNYAGDYIKADVSSLLAAGAEKYDLEGGFELLFDGGELPPDLLSLKIYDTTNGALLFDDLYANIGTLKIEKSMSVAVEASAKWYEDSTRTYFGETTYNFEMNVSAPAEFYLGDTEIQPGEFVVLSAVNVKSPDKITFASEPDISYTPVWYSDGELIHALIPINMELTEGTYKFTLGYAGVTQEVNLGVTARAFGTSDVNYSSSVLNTANSDTAKSDFKTALTPIAKAGSATRYWDGMFADVSKTFTLVAGYGRYMNVNSGKETYRHTGIDYSVGEGKEIKAVNSGVVVYAGYTDYAGFMVVVEHGYGLKSWYALLKEASVAVGDVVTKEQTVGISGNTGFTSGNRVHIALSVFDVPVCTYWLWEETVPFHDFGN